MILVYCKIKRYIEAITVIIMVNSKVISFPISKKNVITISLLGNRKITTYNSIHKICVS